MRPISDAIEILNGLLRCCAFARNKRWHAFVDTHGNKNAVYRKSPKSTLQNHHCHIFYIPSFLRTYIGSLINSSRRAEWITIATTQVPACRRHRSGASEGIRWELKPGTAERKRTRLETAEPGHQFGEFRFSEMLDENLPIPPAAVFEHAFRQPCRMPLRIDAGPIHVPEQVV